MSRDFKHVERAYNDYRPQRHPRFRGSGRRSGNPYNRNQPYDRNRSGLRSRHKQRESEDILGTKTQRKILNWMKRFLITKYIKYNTSVLDLCCGRGQDLEKYHHQKVNQLTLLDIAENELHMAKQAYHEKETEYRMTLGQTGEPRFQQTDLRSNVLFIQPKVQTVCCQLALHYLWGANNHIENFFSTVTGSLAAHGFLLLTIIDADKLPKDGLTTHPYLWFSPVYDVLVDEVKLPPDNDCKLDIKDTVSSNLKIKKQAYKFQYKGRIDNSVEEFVIPRSELLDQCTKHHLKWVQDFSVDNVWESIRHYHVHPDNPLQVSEQDWYALRLYRCYAFQFEPPVT